VREVKGNCDHVSHVSCSLAFDLWNMYCIQSTCMKNRTSTVGLIHFQTHSVVDLVISQTDVVFVYSVPIDQPTLFWIKGKGVGDRRQTYHFFS
jgi:hypothetical protein